MEFYGEFEHTIDDKGRVVLPAAYRGEFTSGGFTAFIGPYIGIFTPGEWNRYRRKLEDSGEFDRVDLQTLYSFVTPFTPDAQHRIMVNPLLREQLGIEREVTIVGTRSHFAIYPRDRWASVRQRAFVPADDGRTLIDKFAALGFA